MKRSALDAFATDHRLDERAVAVALALTGAHPDAAAWRAFAARLCHGAGIASLAAGLVFFVAANWQEYGVIGRFVLVEAALVASSGVALWRPPPSPIGRGALVFAIIVTGALLALFGQAYQTGADLYELFFGWALLALPFAIAGRAPAPWATWWIVLNVGLALACGWLGPGHVMWQWLDRLGTWKSSLWVLPFAVNLAGAGVFRWGGARLAGDRSRWLVRLLLSIAFAYGTLASIYAVTSQRGERWPIVAFAAVSVVVAALTLRSKRDVLPMALVIASWIAISTAAIIDTMKSGDIGIVLVVGIWLVASSGIAGVLLTGWARTWRVDDDAGEVHA